MIGVSSRTFNSFPATGAPGKRFTHQFRKLVGETLPFASGPPGKSADFQACADF
jgi:hypothetical protein